MKKEQAFDFRKELLTVHEVNVRDYSRTACDHEFLMPEQVSILISPKAGEVTQVAAHDFADYLHTSMGLDSVVVTGGSAAVTVSLAEEAGLDLKDYATYRGFMIETDANGIRVYGHDERGIAQGLYYLEDKMSFAKAPAIAFGTICKKPAFSPQMVHSGYGFGIFPDEHLMRIAHEGRDAIAYCVSGKEGEDIKANDLIKRAARYGIDVYAYSEFISRMHPEDPGAEDFYDNIYGRLFRNCPGFKGVILVGESVEFPSHDSRTSGIMRENSVVDGIPIDEPAPGWYPCSDYPDWLNMVKGVIRKEKPDAEILFWTYNWGYQPEDARLELIENLPTDIVLLVTYEMFHKVQYANSVGFCCDYTLVFEGPGDYFKSEAIAAKKRGLRLYSMTNTAGLAWDLGVIPYQPMPYQWMRRYKTMFQAKEDWGLSGIMESHHYGIYPSFISKLSKHCFLEPHEPMEDILKEILISEYGAENYECVDAALQCVSEAIRYNTPSNADQYGAMRVGPSYPFNLSESTNVQPKPGESIHPFVMPRYHNWSEPNQSPLSVRIHDEIRYMEKNLELMEQGMAHFAKAVNPNEKLQKLQNLCQFITNSTKTGLAAKKWHVLICRMNVEPTKEGLIKIYDEMEALLRAEIKNAEETIPLVEQDSRLGWEPYMGNLTDRWHLEWKIRQVEHVLRADLGEYRRVVKL